MKLRIYAATIVSVGIAISTFSPTAGAVGVSVKDRNVIINPDDPLTCQNYGSYAISSDYNCGIPFPTNYDQGFSVSPCQDGEHAILIKSDVMNYKAPTTYYELSRYKTVGNVQYYRATYSPDNYFGQYVTPYLDQITVIVVPGANMTSPVTSEAGVDMKVVGANGTAYFAEYGTGSLASPGCHNGVDNLGGGISDSYTGPTNF